MKSLDIQHQYLAIDAALDLLGPAERSHFDDYRFYHPELDDFSCEMEDLVADISLCAPPTHPSSDLFERIEKNIEELERASLPTRAANRVVSLPWGWPVAACLALALVWALTNQESDSFAGTNPHEKGIPSSDKGSGASVNDDMVTTPDASGGIDDAGPEVESRIKASGEVKSLLADNRLQSDKQRRAELDNKVQVLENRLRELEFQRELRFEVMADVSRMTVVMLTKPGQEVSAEGASPVDRIGDIINDGLLGAFMPSAPSFEADSDDMGDFDSPDLTGARTGGDPEGDSGVPGDAEINPQAFFVYDEARGEGSLLLTGMDQPEEGSQYTLWTESDAGETIRLLDLPRGDALSGLYEIKTERTQVAPSNIYITLEPDNGKAPEGPVVLRGADRSAAPIEP